MAVAPVAMFRNVLPTTSGTLATVPSGKTWVVTNIVVVNTSTSTQTVTVSLDGVEVLPGVTVLAKSVVPFDLRQVLATTKTITGVASDAAVKCHISGSEVS